MPVSFVGVSALEQENGSAPAAITVHASTVATDVVIHAHYTNADTGTESWTPDASPAFTAIFNANSSGFGLLGMAYRVWQAGDGAVQATVANHLASTTGDCFVERLLTFRGVDTANPIKAFTAANSTWATSLTMGPVAVPASATVDPGDAVLVYAGRRENILGQTVLTGNSLTWSTLTIDDTTLGRDGGAVYQLGVNLSGTAQTVTAKSIVTTGTTQAGCGRMVILQAITTTTHAAAGAASSVSTATATLTMTGAVVGAASSVSAGSADLTLPATTLAASGTASSVSSASGALTRITPLSGAASSVSSASAALVVRYGLSASASSTSSASGSLTRVTPVSGGAASVSTSSGALAIVTVHAGSGAAVSVSSCSAALTVVIVHTVTGAASAVSVAAGALTLRGAVSGTASGVSSASGALTLRAAVSGGAASVSSASGAVTLRGALVGGVASVSLAAATLTLRAAVVGQAASTSFAVAALDLLSAGGPPGPAAFTGYDRAVSGLSGSPVPDAAVQGGPPAGPTLISIGASSAGRLT